MIHGTPGAALQKPATGPWPIYQKLVAMPPFRAINLAIDLRLPRG
jgi:hypothetical protein